MSPPKNRFPSHSAGQRGSALILALMVMLVLTFLGLTLMAMTETEMMLGSYHQVNTAAHYAAEAGSAVADARIMDGAVTPADFVIEEAPGLAANFRLGHRVSLSRAVAIRFVPCDFCPANEDEQSWSYRVTYLVNSHAQRRDWRSIDPSNPVPAAVQTRALVSVTKEIQPSEQPLLEAVPTPEEAELIVR